jgi:phosphoglycolate phosphatase-like HAD superfamily hydrolase
MTDPTPTKTARLSEESLAFATVLNAAVDRADRAERLEFATRRGRDAAIARAIAAEDRAIAAEQMVAELRATLTAGRDIVIETSSRHTRWVEGAYDTLEASAPVANRWCLASERDAAIAENSRLRHAALEVLSWSAQRLLREAMGD